MAYKMSEQLKYSSDSTLMYNLIGTSIITGINNFERFCPYNVKLGDDCGYDDDVDLSDFFQRQDVREALGIG